MCFVCEVSEPFRSYLNQRVKIPGRLAEDLHGDRIGLRLVLNLTEGVDAVPEDFL